MTIDLINDTLITLKMKRDLIREYAEQAPLRREYTSSIYLNLSVASLNQAIDNLEYLKSFTAAKIK